MTNGRRCAGKRRKGGSGLAFNPQPTDYFVLKKTEFLGPTPPKTLLWPLCASECFWVWDQDGETKVLHSSSRRATGGDEKSSVFYPSSVIPVSLTYKNYPSFALPMKAARTQYPKTPPETGLRGPDSSSFWYVALRTSPIVFVCLSTMVPPFVPCDLTPHFFFPAPPHPTTPFLG